jgi:hypothetical protein
MKKNKQIQEIDREIGLFECCLEDKLIDSEIYVKVSRENRLVQLGLFVFTENPEDQFPKIFSGTSK